MCDTDVDRGDDERDGFRRLEDIYGRPSPPHYLWTIKMINEEDYDLLQKALRQGIRDSFDDRISLVQYDDIMGPRQDH